jgi:hypothetical protein
MQCLESAACWSAGGVPVVDTKPQHLIALVGEAPHDGSLALTERRRQEDATASRQRSATPRVSYLSS